MSNKFYTRIIPSSENNTLSINDIFYIEGGHLDIFLEPQKYKLNLLKEYHYRIDLFTDYQNKKITSNYQNILCIDIDQIREEKKQITDAEIDAIIDFFVQKRIAQKNQISTNRTARGLHCYLFFDEYFRIDDESWLKYALRSLHDDFSIEGYAIDLMSFNARKTMRFPGSIYSKVTPVYQCQADLKKVVLNWQSFKAQFKELSLDERVKQQTPNETLKTMHLNKDIDWKAILGEQGAEWSGCRFLRWNYEAPDQVNYQEWISQLTLTTRFFKDRQQAFAFARQFNMRSTKFKEDEFAHKFVEALDKMHPVSCKHIESVWTASKKPKIGCIDCPHKRLNNPLNITAYPDQSTGFKKVFVNTKGKQVVGELNFESFFKYLREKEKVYCNEDGSLWQWKDDEKLYKPDSILALMRYYKHLIHDISVKDMKDIEFRFPREKVFKSSVEDKKMRDKVFFKNGILDLKTGKMIDYKNSNIINTYCLNFDFDEDADCPTYNELIDFAFEDKNQRDYFFKYITTALWSEYSTHTALILYGDGSNGKSSLMNGIMDMFNKGSKAILPFNIESLRRDETYISSLNYSKISYCADSESNFTQGQGAMLKRIIGGEQMSYRLKYQKNTVSFQNNSKLILGMNQLPFINEDSYGLKRRLAILNFPNRFPIEKRDMNFREKIKMEGAGIFNLLHFYYRDFMKDKIYPTLDSKVYDEGRMLADEIFAFYKEKINITKRKTDYISNDDLYEEFITYCNDQNIHSTKFIKKTVFAKRIAKLLVGRSGVKKNKTRTERGWSGIRVLKENETNDQEEAPF